MSEKSVIIVGAGMAGLIAANRLQDAGWDVTLLDKGRGVGGRMSTRRFGGASFDHGAQFFTVRDGRFQQYVDAWMGSGTVVEWAQGFPNAQGESSSGQHPRYRGASGMTSAPKALAERVNNLRTSTEVQQIDLQDGVWTLQAEDKGTNAVSTYTADALLMTPPAEQTLRLMRSGNVTLPQPVTDALAAIDFNPSFAVMALLDRPSAMPEPGGMFMPGEPIRWIADNQLKGISEAPAVTIHSGPEFTRAHYDDDRDAVAKLLIEAARPQLGDAQIVDYQVQRWKYSQPTAMHPDKTLFTAQPAPVAFAGDAFDGARVEGAAVSGMAAADRLLAAFGAS
jgi:renalase